MSTVGEEARTSLGLPAQIKACLFDLDGVLTQTAKVHAAAWKRTFDDYLRQRAEQRGEKFVPFDEASDYNQYVDGKPRLDGIRSFFASRGIELPLGSPDDAPGKETVSGLGNRKNELVLRLIHTEGVAAYPGSLRYLERMAAAGMARAVVSSSANCRAVLHSAGLDHFFEVIVDG
ncbi:MAG: HAD family hydrolase, partial [Candidatus Dormibacteraceae bacterium]